MSEVLDGSTQVLVPQREMSPLERELRGRLTAGEAAVFDRYLIEVTRGGDPTVDIVCLFSRGLHITMAVIDRKVKRSG